MAMDRTLPLNTTIHNQKKFNGCEKLTESFLCEEIHDNLRVLALVHPFSDEFRAVFEKGMFIKPNAKAFPHVIKYLLTICDSNEFKKKFCWPIYNKAAEATFRNSTLELLNKLNVTYRLGLSEVKNKILIFPGGMEFMRVIYEVTRLAMQLILKRNGITNPENQMPITLSGVKKHLENLEDVCDFVMNHKQKVQEYSAQLKSKTDTLHKLLEKVTANTNIKSENILYDKFTDSWSNVHNEIVERGIEPDVERLIRFQSKCQQLEEKIEVIFKQHTLKFDITALESFAMEMQKLYPQNSHEISKIIENGSINLDHLFKAFNLAIPPMLRSAECYKPRSIEAMAYESNRLQKLSHTTDDLLQKILILSKPFDMEAMECIEKHNVAVGFENIQSKIFSTPTISHDAIQRAECAALKSKRLALLEDAYQFRAITTSTLTSTSNRITKPLNAIFDESRCNQSGNQKEFLSPAKPLSKEPKNKLDPMAILQSITKKTKTDKHVTNGTFKPKVMNVGIVYNLFESSRMNDTTLSVPDFSSTLVNQSNDIRGNEINVIEQINTSLAESAGRTELKMRSLLTTDLDLLSHDLNSSPSGRIEPLVASKLSPNDIHLNKSDEIIPITQEPNRCHTQNQQNIIHSYTNNSESNKNKLNKFVFNLNNMIDENDESLLNISDRILNELNLDDSNLS